MGKKTCYQASAPLTTPLFLLALWTVILMALPHAGLGQVTIVQLSDTHIGLSTAPRAAANLREAVEMINKIRPDAVVLSGDIGENLADWQLARSILSGLTVPLFYAPGNHDVHTHNVGQYRGVFGPDYYRFDVRGIIFLVVDSQLLGNFDNGNATTPPPLPADTQAESNKMMAWLSGQEASISKGAVVIGIQHIPDFREGGFPSSLPFWVISEPFRSREMTALEKIGVKHMLVGHWHSYRIFSDGGITWHVAPTTSHGSQLGFVVHTISSSGDVKSQFVPLR